MNLLRRPVIVAASFSFALLVSACAGPGACHHQGSSMPAGEAGYDACPHAKMPTSVAVDERMQTMRSAHEKMVNAKTDEERQALMAEHMQAMHGGMEMMKSMGCMGAMGHPAHMSGMGHTAHMGEVGAAGGTHAGMAERHPMMGRHMEMMQLMMEMMRDRMPPKTPTSGPQ